MNDAANVLRVLAQKHRDSMTHKPGTPLPWRDNPHKVRNGYISRNEQTIRKDDAYELFVANHYPALIGYLQQIANGTNKYDAQTTARKALDSVNETYIK